MAYFFHHGHRIRHLLWMLTNSMRLEKALHISHIEILKSNSCASSCSDVKKDEHSRYYFSKCSVTNMPKTILHTEYLLLKRYIIRIFRMRSHFHLLCHLSEQTHLESVEHDLIALLIYLSPGSISSFYTCKTSTILSSIVLFSITNTSSVFRRKVPYFSYKTQAV
jgi:hypothetical protein